MEKYLPFVQSNVENVEGVCNFTFLGPKSAIISDSYDHKGTQICILIEFSFPCIFK